MSEEKQSAPSEQPQQSGQERDAAAQRRARSQQKRRQSSVFQYITILFAAAFVLLLFTFVMERRQHQLLQQENQEQIDNLQQSVTAVQSLQNLYNENEALREKVADLERQLQTAAQDRQSEKTSLLQQAERQQKALDAMDWFWQINEAYVKGRYGLCRVLIQSMEEDNLADYLPRESITDNERFSPYDRYQEICDHVN